MVVPLGGESKKSEDAQVTLFSSVDLAAGKTATANLTLKATAAAQERVGISGARAQENYGPILPTWKWTGRERSGSDWGSRRNLRLSSSEAMSRPALKMGIEN